MLMRDMEEIWQCRFPKRSQQCYVILTERNDNLMVQIFEGSTKTRIEYCKKMMDFYVIYELFKDIMAVFQSSQN